MRKSNASPLSNPDQAMSQRSVSWCGESEPDSQIVQGRSPTPIAPNPATTQIRIVRELTLIACLHCRKWL